MPSLQARSLRLRSLPRRGLGGLAPGIVASALCVALGACGLNTRGNDADALDPAASSSSSGSSSSGGGAGGDDPSGSGGMGGASVATGAGGSGGSGGSGGGVTTSTGAGGSGGAGGGPLGAPFCDPTDLSLLVCYEFEGSVTDGSSYGNDASTTKSIAYVPGISGMAISRGPTSVVTAPPSPSVSDAPIGSIEVWIKPTEIPPGNLGAMTPRAGLLDNGRYSLFLYPGGTIRCALGSYLFKDAAVKAGQWAHIACVLDAGTQTIYINGKPAGTLAGAGPASGPDLMAIGADSPSGTADPFDGLMDSVRVFSLPRSAAQICQAAGGVGCP